MRFRDYIRKIDTPHVAIFVSTLAFFVSILALMAQLEVVQIFKERATPSLRVATDPWSKVEVGGTSLTFEFSILLANDSQRDIAATWLHCTETDDISGRNWNVVYFGDPRARCMLSGADIDKIWLKSGDLLPLNIRIEVAKPVGIEALFNEDGDLNSYASDSVNIFGACADESECVQGLRLVPEVVDDPHPSGGRHDRGPCIVLMGYTAFEEYVQMGPICLYLKHGMSGNSVDLTTQDEYVPFGRVMSSPATKADQK